MLDVTRGWPSMTRLKLSADSLEEPTVWTIVVVICVNYLKVKLKIPYLEKERSARDCVKM